MAKWPFHIRDQILPPRQTDLVIVWRGAMAGSRYRAEIITAVILPRWVVLPLCWWRLCSVFTLLDIWTGLSGCTDWCMLFSRVDPYALLALVCTVNCSRHFCFWVQTIKCVSLLESCNLINKITYVTYFLRGVYFRSISYSISIMISDTLTVILSLWLLWFHSILEEILHHNQYSVCGTGRRHYSTHYSQKVCTKIDVWIMIPIQ